MKAEVKVKKEALYTRKDRQKRKEVYHELTFLPGACAQIDWLEVRFPWGVAYGFAVILAYSRYLYVRFYPRERLELFLVGHLEVFREMGEVAHQHGYDNIKTVVIQRSPALKLNAKFLDLARHYGSSPDEPKWTNTLVTTNLVPSDWEKIFDAVTATAILDRLSMNGAFITCEGKSYPWKE